ncbi:hypothetical protein PLESTB_000456200 [Pleodorina starrii]|uniref:Uncharacterized protein n=1 Tax=Pleodorina starrii TaxID=330485 RepID=A0A9W6BFA0_9CHLO|nr:hypothetical protein PLESTM_000757700 [Pleodorina starrii]GLC51009.1 hypothetical protein PLESTB_000456200 [Pleodorina starrii]
MLSVGQPTPALNPAAPDPHASVASHTTSASPISPISPISPTPPSAALLGASKSSRNQPAPPCGPPIAPLAPPGAAHDLPHPRRALLAAVLATAAAAALSAPANAAAPYDPQPGGGGGGTSGMTLEDARAATAAAVRSLQSAYDRLIELDSCTAVENLPDCLDAAAAAALASQLADSCRTLTVALPVVAAAIAYDTPPPAKRRSGPLGALLGSLERAAGAAGGGGNGGRSLDVADLEWLEEVEGRTNTAVAQLELLRRAAEGVLVTHGSVAGGGNGGSGGGRSPVAVLGERRRRLAELAGVCLRDVRAVLEV